MAEMGTWKAVGLGLVPDAGMRLAYGAPQVSQKWRQIGVKSVRHDNMAWIKRLFMLWPGAQLGGGLRNQLTGVLILHWIKAA